MHKQASDLEFANANISLQLNNVESTGAPSVRARRMQEAGAVYGSSLTLASTLKVCDSSVWWCSVRAATKLSTSHVSQPTNVNDTSL